MSFIHSRVIGYCFERPGKVQQKQFSPLTLKPFQFTLSKIPSIQFAVQQNVCRSTQRPPRDGVPFRWQKWSPDLCYLPRRLANLFVAYHLSPSSILTKHKTVDTSATRIHLPASRPPSMLVSTSLTLLNHTLAASPNVSWAEQSSILAGIGTTLSFRRR